MVVLVGRRVLILVHYFQHLLAPMVIAKGVHGLYFPGGSRVFVVSGQTSLTHASSGVIIII